MESSKQSKQVLLSVIGVAILVVAVVGVSFAFFNYTRTGAENTVKTGHIEFNSTNTVLTLTDFFPVATADVNTLYTEANNNVGVVAITGNTTYANGIDFTVTADSVSTNIGTTPGKLPLSVTVTPENLTNVTNLVTNNFDTTTVITNGAVLASGKIPANTTVNGKLIIRAYIDNARIAITDTSTRAGDPSVAPTDGSVNGTTDADWIHGRVVMTTEQWNALQSTAASFKIKVEANEGA